MRIGYKRGGKGKEQGRRGGEKKEQGVYVTGGNIN